ncbi:uncharacterized protein [Diadema antillarum]|uniref:uncharacterized protein n=1 Tax=Diadema antillarum TaxID=105358 RepID=UPI003A846EC2
MAVTAPTVAAFEEAALPVIRGLKPPVRDTVGPFKKENGETVPLGQQTANILNEYFASVYTKEDPIVPNPQKVFKGTDEDLLTEIEITEDCVGEKLENLDPSKAPGPDDIRPAFLKPLAEELSVPFTIMFRKSLKEGCIPEEWRSAYNSNILRKGQDLNLRTIDQSA